MKEKQTLASKGLAFGPSVFCDDGEDAMYTTFPDGHTVKYVPERTCTPIRRGTIISCGACGSELHEPFRFCGGCGAKVVE